MWVSDNNDNFNSNWKQTKQLFVRSQLEPYVAKYHPTTISIQTLNANNGFVLFEAF